MERGESMDFNFNEAIDRAATVSIKWSPELRREMYGEDGVIPMGIADMDLKTAPCVAEAIQKRAAHKTYGYGYASREYLAACAGWQRERHGWEVKPEWICYTPGVNMALVCAVEMYTLPGERVIIQSPVYYPYYDYVRGTGRKIAYNPLVERGGRWEMDFAALEALAREPDVRLMILCSPHNPVGRAWTREELERVGRICIDNGVMLAVDEIHADLVLPPNRHVPFASISGEFARSCIVCTSPSKTFNLAGLLVSDIIIPDDGIRAAFEAKMQPYYLWPGTFGTVAQIAAYTRGAPWLDALLEFLAGNARHIEEFIAARMPRVRFRAPEATYLGWLDFRACGMGPEELWDFMLREARVATDNGPMFGPNGEGDGFQRLNFACPRQQLDAALERIASALERRGLAK